MLDGISKYISLSLSIFLSILLGTEDDSLASMHSVNPVYHLVKPLHFLELFSIDVEEILLNGRVGTDAHDDDSGFLVLVSLTIDFLKDLVRGLRNGYSGTCRGD